MSVAIVALACSTAGDRNTAFGADSANANSVRKNAATASIVFTADLRGAVAPVGCEQGHFGGLARIVAHLREARAAEAGLLIDGGNWLPEHSDTAAFDVFAQSHVRAGYQILALGRNELRSGAVHVVASARAQGIAVVATNVVDRRGNRVAERSMIWSSPTGVRIGVVALVSPRILLSTRFADVQLQDPYRSGRQAIAELRRKDVDVIVAVAHGKPGFANRVSRLDVDFVISSGTKGALPVAVAAGEGRYLGRVGDAGRYIAHIDINLAAGSTRRARLELAETAAMTAAAAARAADARADTATRLAQAVARNGNSGSGGGAALIRRLEAKLSALDRPQKPKAPGDRQLTYELEEMGLDLPEDAEMVAEIARARPTAGGGL